MFCDMNDLDNKTIKCHKGFPRRRLAGEKVVESPKECFSGVDDEKGYCVGAKVGESCSNNGDADCDVDLFCGEKRVCEHAKLEGEWCNRKNKCASYLLCAWEDGVESKCRPYGFHVAGDSVGIGEEEDICDTHYLNSLYNCEHGPSLMGPNIKDRPGDKCGYSHGEDDHSRCYYHYDGKAMCRRGPQDLMPQWRTVLAYLRRRPKCHITIPMSQCERGREVMPDENSWKDVWRAISYLHWENQMEGVLECMKDYVHPDAFKYDRKISFAGYWTLSLVTLLPLIMLLF